MKSIKVKKMVMVAVFSAISFALQMIAPFPKVGGFLEIEFSDLPALILAFAYGPVAGLLTELIKNLLHLTVSTTGFVGELANFVVNGIFVMVAGLIYINNKTFKTAILSLVAATVAMAVAGVFVNLYIMLPMFKIPEELRLGLTMGTIFPFNLVKGAVTSLITMLIYKRISPIIKFSGGRK